MLVTQGHYNIDNNTDYIRNKEMVWCNDVISVNSDPRCKINIDQQKKQYFF